MQATQRVFEVTGVMREQYERDGYFVTEPVFEPALLETLRGEFLRIWNEQIEEAKGIDAKTLLYTRNRPFLAALSQQSQACSDFLRHPVLLELARQIVGPDADVSWHQGIIKPPAVEDFSNSFAWHQDHYYGAHGNYAAHWNRERLLDWRHGFQGWVALTRTTIANGTLWVMPGLHRNGFLSHVRDTERNEWVCQLDDTNKRAVELEPGQMLVFSGLTPHASGPNTTSETRMAYQFGFVRPGTTTVPMCLPVMRHGSPV